MHCIIRFLSVPPRPATGVKLLTSSDLYLWTLTSVVWRVTQSLSFPQAVRRTPWTVNLVVLATTPTPHGVDRWWHGYGLCLHQEHVHFRCCFLLFSYSLRQLLVSCCHNHIRVENLDLLFIYHRLLYAKLTLLQIAKNCHFSKAIAMAIFFGKIIIFGNFFFHLKFWNFGITFLTWLSKTVFFKFSKHCFF